MEFCSRSSRMHKQDSILRVDPSEGHYSSLNSSSRVHQAHSLLERSGVSEEIEQFGVSVDDGPFREEVRRPNLDRSEQVYVATGPNGHQLRISYDEGVESGLLLTVQAIQV